MFSLGAASRVARTDGFLVWMSVTGGKLMDDSVEEANFVTNFANTFKVKFSFMIPLALELEFQYCRAHRASWRTFASILVPFLLPRKQTGSHPCEILVVYKVLWIS